MHDSLDFNGTYHYVTLRKDEGSRAIDVTLEYKNGSVDTWQITYADFEKLLYNSGLYLSLNQF